MTGSARDLPEVPAGGTPVTAGPRTASGHDAAWLPFRAAVLRELEDFFASPAHRVPRSPGFPLLWERIREQLAGGKLIRPRLTLIAWRSFAQVSGGGAAAQVPDASCVRLAASFEMLHAALLVHDDVVDRDWRRRGRPTVGELFRRDAVAAGASAEEAEHAGESAAILAGDLLLSGALRLATTCTADPRRSRAVADVVFEAVTASAAGELDDLLLSLRRFGAGHPGVQDILDMERLKTATYSFEAPLRAGALLAGAAAEDAERLARAGALLGVGYQVVDDAWAPSGTRRSRASPWTRTCARARPPCSRPTGCRSRRPAGCSSSSRRAPPRWSVRGRRWRRRVRGRPPWSWPPTWWGRPASSWTGWPCRRMNAPSWTACATTS